VSASKLTIFLAIYSTIKIKIKSQNLYFTTFSILQKSFFCLLKFFNPIKNIYTSYKQSKEPTAQINKLLFLNEKKIVQSIFVEDKST
jgi:hypothetical protein